MSAANESMSEKCHYPAAYLRQRPHFLVTISNGTPTSLRRLRGSRRVAAHNLGHMEQQVVEFEGLDLVVSAALAAKGGTVTGFALPKTERLQRFAR